MIAQIEPFATPEIAWSAILPLLILFGGALVLLVIAALTTKPWPRGVSTSITLVTGIAAGASAFAVHGRVTDADRGPFTAIAEAITMDSFSVFVTVVICAGLVLAVLLSDDYLRRELLDGPELHALMLLSASGGIVMGVANDLIVLFLGLETLSIALYVMAGFHLRRAESQESAMKYFVLGAFSSAFLLYGIALVYGATGSTNLSSINAFLSDNVLASDGLLLAGFALLLVGLGFKIAAVPFHSWTPDVYQGAPTPVTAFMASVSKAAAFAGLIRVFTLTFDVYALDWTPIVWVLSVLSLVVGAVLAIVQTDVKRMLAYSSVAHAGFILIGIEAASDRGTQASLFYLLAYTFMIAGSFGIATVVGRTGDARHSLDDYKGLAAGQPALALAFTVFLLAQAGVPLTTGFLAKFYVIGAAAESHSYALALIAMVSSVISAFLYLRIIVAMYMNDPAEGATRIPVPLGAGVAIVVCVAFTLAAGIVPDPVVDWVKDAVPVLLAAP
ncbi:MAG: NADH-quinone oxidoreductase subunit N [Acidimicrobiia bacterium]